MTRDTKGLRGRTAELLRGLAEHHRAANIPRSDAPRRNAVSVAPRRPPGQTQSVGRGASLNAFPLRAWERVQDTSRLRGKTTELLSVVLVLATLECSGVVSGQTTQAAVPWDLKALGQSPSWETLQRPTADTARAIFFKGPSFQGKPTRVFAWLGMPALKAGEKAPGMVLVHGGGGTAFDEWVRLWVKRGYAAIAMDTCGKIPVGT